MRALVVVALAWLSVTPLVASGNPYLDELVQRARVAGLAGHDDWHRLLHYKPNLLRPGVHGQVDDPAFYNAPNGKSDPPEEIEATLAAFFADDAESDAHQPAQCRFRARYRWLNERLGFDPARLPPAPCRRYQAWRQALDVQAVTLIFASAYLNSPASMFGHTLLRLDSRDQDERTRLLAQTVNYAAVNTDKPGFVYAVKGLTGGYRGKFTIAPYYIKVRDYNDLEDRDLWEYRLNLSPEEIERLLAHLWELGPVYFDYYFLDENCSYHLLSLLEVARPGIELTGQFRGWAIPAETVRAVIEQRGMLNEAVYRPATASILRHRLGSQGAVQAALARELAEGAVAIQALEARLPDPRQQAAVLEVAHEYDNHRRLASAAEPAPDGQRRDEILRARSRLDVPPLPALPVPTARPDQGHLSGRVTFGIGRERRRDFAQLQWRPLYHDLLDPEAGFNRGAQIGLLDLTVRQYRDDDETRLESLRLVDVVSLTARDAFFSPLSWKANAGWARQRLENGREPLLFRLNVGAGWSWELSPASPDSLVSIMLEATLDVEDEFARGYAFGIGPSAAWLVDITPRWRAHLQARTQRFGLGESRTSHELALAQRYTLESGQALRLDLVRRGEYGRHVNETAFSWLVYY
jgi:hypothetical protein